MNKTGLIAKISIKYVLPTCIWKYFWRISRYFAEIPEFRGSATARNIRSPVEQVVSIGHGWRRKSRADIARNVALQRNCHSCYATTSMFHAPRKLCSAIWKLMQITRGSWGERRRTSLFPISRASYFPSTLFSRRPYYLRAWPGLRDKSREILR